MSRQRNTLLVVLTALLLATPILAAEDDAPDPNDVAEDYAKDFKRSYKKMTSGELIEGVDKLAAFYLDEKVDDDGAKKRLLDSLSRAASVRDHVVVAHVLQKCAEVGEGSIKIVLIGLKRELSQKVPREDVYEAAIDTLGKIHSEIPVVTKTLTDLLNNKEYPIIARAALAMVGYKNACGRVRKDLFEELLKISEGTYNSAQAGDENYKRKWAVIGTDVMDALVALSRVKLDNPKVARDWFNKHKKESWDRED